MKGLEIPVDTRDVLQLEIRGRGSERIRYFFFFFRVLPFSPSRLALGVRLTRTILYK